MTYKQFKEAIVRELKPCFPPETSLLIRKVPRNNNINLDALTIFENGCNISPTIYLARYFERFRNGLTFQKIICEIIDTYKRSRPEENIDPAFFYNFENIRHQIVYKLINQKQNRILLKDIPHITYLDLAIVFYCLLSSTTYGNSTILIRNHHLNTWNTTTEKLYELARINTPLLLPPQRKELSQLIDSMLPEGLSIHIDGVHKELPYHIYVLSNISQLNGAVCILYDHLLQEIANNFASDLYVLPSSIHEVLLVPTTETTQNQLFTDIVRSVNYNQVAAEDILSNHAYYYSRNEQRLMEQPYEINI
jgi:hypothetical protein